MRILSAILLALSACAWNVRTDERLLAVERVAEESRFHMREMRQELAAYSARNTDIECRIPMPPQFGKPGISIDGMTQFECDRLRDIIYWSIKQTSQKFCKPIGPGM